MTDVSDFVAVLPSIYPPYLEPCLASMDPRLRERTQVVDNTDVNLGVAASWNLGLRDLMQAEDARWCLIISAAVRFDRGGFHFIDQLRDGDLRWGAISRLGWHLAAIGRPMVERVGYFDENFYPGYMEDTDYTLRMHIAGTRDRDIQVPTLEVPDTLASVGHARKLAGVTVDQDAAERYWRQKWGYPSQSPWRTGAPFGGRALSYWPDPAR